MRNSNIDRLGFITEPRKSSRCPEERVTDLDGCKRQRRHAKTTKQSLTTSQVGLIINTQDTKVISYNQANSNNIELNGQPLEAVDDFQNLGSYVGSIENDLRNRKEKAWSTFWILENTWKSKADLDLKLRSYSSSVLSVLLYGSETWVITPEFEKVLKLNCFYMLLVYSSSWDQKRRSHHQ